MGMKRTPDTIRSEREVIGAQIERLRAKQKALSDELREAEGPIPDRAGRPAKEAEYTVRTA
jgi:hypothetical protein